MLNRTRVCLTIPQVHLAVGGTPSARGHLYRPSNQNKFHQMLAKNQSQRTWNDHQQYMILQNPEVYMMAVMTLGLMLVTATMTYSNLGRTQENQYTASIVAAGNTAELFQRNYEMAEVLRRHRTVIDQVRKEIGEVPDVLRPPESNTRWTS